MGKRVAILFVFLMVIALGILVYFFLQGRRGLFTDPYKSITPDACIIIETVDLQSFMNSITTEQGMFGETSKIKELENFYSKIKYLSDKLRNPGFIKILNSETSLISLYPDEKGNLKPLLSVIIPGEMRLRQFKEILYSIGIKEMIESKLKGYPLIKIPFANSSSTDTVYISLISGLMVCSSSDQLIEKAGIQMESETDIRNLPGFSRVLLASGKNEDKIFVVFSNLQKILGSILAKDESGLADKIVRLAGTACGDIYINDDGLVLSGYTESVDSSDYLYRYKFIQPQAFQTYKILPSSTVLFETLVLPPDRSVRRSAAKASPEVIDLAVSLAEYSGNEITRALIDTRDNQESGNALIIYKLKNRVQAEQIFLRKLGAGNEILHFEPDDQVSIPVYLTDFKGFSEIMIPGFAPGFNDSYFTFYDNYMITGNSFSTVSSLLYDNLLNKTLANDLIYRDFESTLPSRAAYFFYCVPSRITEYLSGFLNDRIIKALTSNINSLNKIQAAGYQLASSNDMIYNSLSVMFKDEARAESTTDWETLLDTIACIKPFFFTNHNTGAKEIFIQDMNNYTYLINAAGRVLWKVPLRERITGTIYMIDYYKNGKYQLLFSGKNYIHLLDRNGNYVERYPVKLRSPATNPLALFDYDNNLNYRLFIAGEDKRIYSYDKTGNVVKGWKPFMTTGVVESEICYFKVSGKDYIVASDETSLFFLDRTGNIRIKLKEAVTKARGSAMRLETGSKPSVVCSSPNGTVQHIYFDGSVMKFKIRDFSANHLFDIFDIDGDGFGEYIFIDKGILYLYDNNRSEIFTRDFGSTDLGGPINFIFSGSDRKIGVFDEQRKLIYLINKNGETMNGFPLKGASMVSIGKLSDMSGWQLIVGGTDRFLYNYKIDTDIK